MIGQHLESRPGFPVGAVLWTIVTAALLGAAVAFGNVNLGILALLPGSLGLACLLTRERSFHAEVTSEGLDIEQPALFLPYEDLVGVVIAWESAQAPIRLFYSAGRLSIPARLNVHSVELFAFLLSKMPLNKTRNLPAPLAKYLADQQAEFGLDQVQVYRVEPSFGPLRRWSAIAKCFALVLTGFGWILIGNFLPQDGAAWITNGSGVAFIAGFFALLFFMQTSRPPIRNWQESALIVSPTGLAVIQGEVRGQLRWDELREMRYRSTPAFLSFPSGASSAGIHLKIAGATVVIADVYDRPIEKIHECLRSYWEGDGHYA